MKRFFAFLLTLAMVVTMLPVGMVYAADTAVEIQIGTDGKPTAASGDGWSYASGTNTLTLKRGYSFTLSENNCTATVNNYGTITDGVFNGTVNNTSDTQNTKTAGGTINGGTFNGEVVNFHGWGTCTINGGTFNGTVENGNHGVINGGTFNGIVDTYMLGNKVNGGNFKLTLVLGEGALWKDNFTAPSYYSYSTSVTALPTAENINAPSGFKFDGWYDNADLTGSVIKTIPAKSTAVLTYYAKYVEDDSITNWPDLGKAAVADTDYTVDTSGNYTVKTPAGLAYIANLVNGGNNLYGKTVTLANDIDLYDAGISEYKNDGNITEDNSWVPIDGFAGTFDGNGKKISNLYVITTEDDAGLFGSNGGTIANLNIDSGKLTLTFENPADKSEYNIGGIAASSGGLIENCKNSAEIYVNDIAGTTNVNAGGIVGLVATQLGDTTSKVIGCINTGCITNTGESSANIWGGGIAGYLFGGFTIGGATLIDRCSNAGEITLIPDTTGVGTTYAGGITGHANGYIAGNSASLRNCYNTGDVRGKIVGGITGYSEDYVYICNVYNWGSVYGTRDAGGIVGLNLDDTNVIENCYSKGAVSGGMNVGGLVGFNGSAVTHGYYLKAEELDAVGKSGTEYGNGTVTDSYAFTTNGTTHTFTNSASKSVDLLDALNNWVDEKQSSLYLNWIADADNSDYPIFGEAWELTPIVWVGGQGMTASADGSVVSYYTNGNPGTVTQTESDEYHAKLYYDTENSAYTLEINGLDATGITGDVSSLGAGIYSTVPLVIRVTGNNSVSGSITSKNSYGLYVPDLKIVGTDEASLFVTTSEYQAGNSFGIYSEGDVVISDCTIETTGGTDSTTNPKYGVGIYVTGTLTFNNSDVTATGTDSTYQSAGIYVTAPASTTNMLRYSGSQSGTGGAGGTVDPGGELGTTTEAGGITVNGGKLTVYGGRGYYSGEVTAFSDGIYADGAITFNNAEITVESDFGVQGIYAIDSYKSDVTINGGTVTAVSGSGIPPADVTSEGRSSMTFGIYAGNKFTLTAGEVHVTGSENRNSAYGIYAKNDITISGGELIVEAEKSEVQSAGLYTDNNLIISGDALVNATASMAGYRSYGIFVTNNFHMSGNPFVSTTSDITTETSAYTSIRSAALYMGNDRNENLAETDTFTITGGTLIANCIVTDESTATESYAVAMYNVENDEFIFSDASQTNDKWYLWSIDSNGVTEHLSTSKPYVYKDAEENYKSHYLFITPMADSHTVTFFPRNGDVDWNVQVDDGDTVAKPNPDPTKDGFTFVGWFTSDDDGATLAENPYDFDTPVRFDFNLYAKWEPITTPQLYTVTYDLNGGTGADGVNYDSETVTAGTEVTGKAAPTRDGYTFTGWSDGTATYQPGSKITVNRNITLTAQWEKDDTPVDPPIIIPIGSVELTKVDAEDHSTVLSGVVFELYRANGSKVGTYTTNANGKIRVSSLIVGSYYWKEIRSAEGYVLDSAEHPFTVSIYKTTYLVIENEKSDVPEAFTHDHYAYIIGYDDGLVHPEANITRAEVATIFFRLLDEETRNQYMTRENHFTDVSADAWYNTAVSTMAAMGIITGRPGGIFDPNANITRAEFAAIAARFDASGNTTGASFTDIYDHWAKKEINIAANNGWVLGYEDGTFRPDQYITRAEAMTLVNRVLQRIPESVDDLHPDMIVWPDNMDTDEWYYLMVQEATNSHYYVRKDNGYESWTNLREVPDWAELER